MLNLANAWQGIVDRYGNVSVHWPPLDHKDRLLYYEDGYRLYTGDHRDVLHRRAGDGGYEPPIYRLYVSENVCATITDLLVGRAYGDGIAFKAPETYAGTQAFLNELYEHEKCDVLLPKVARGASYRGDAVLKVWFDAVSRRVRITSVRPSVYYPETDPLDETRVIAADISQVLTVWGEAPNGTPNYYLWTERHELRDGMGWITNRLWKLREYSVTKGYLYDPIKDEVALDAIPQTTPLAAQPEYPTGIDDLLVVHIRNAETEEGQPWGASWGLSDYTNLISIQAALNDNRSGFRDILRKMVKPVVTGPDLRDEAGYVNFEDMDYYPMENAGASDGSSLFDIATWDVNTQGVQAELEQILTAVAILAKVDPSAIKTPEAGGPISGKAIKASQFITQTTARHKQAAHTHPLQRVASIATKLAVLKWASGELDWTPPVITEDAVNGAVADLLPCEPEDIRIAWSDGIPEDRMDIITEEVEMVAGGMQSKIRAIMRLHDVPRSEAEKIAQEIEDETPDPLEGLQAFEQGNDDAKQEEGEE